MSTSALLWQPTPERVAKANITAFTQRVSAATGRSFPEYAALWQWSIDDRETFWRTVWDAGRIIGECGERTLVNGDRMPGAQWFPDARLNFAENLLSQRAADDPRDSLIFRGEDRQERHTSHTELVAATSRFAQALATLGVAAGDRVAAYLRN